MEVNTSGKPRLQPYATTTELEERCSAIFSRVDPRFGSYFERMRAEGLLDLESRAHKAPGGYSLEYNVRRVPFIFMNGVPSPRRRFMAGKGGDFAKSCHINAALVSLSSAHE